MNVQSVHPYPGEAGVRDPELAAHRGGGEQVCRGERLADLVTGQIEFKVYVTNSPPLPPKLFIEKYL